MKRPKTSAWLALALIVAGPFAYGALLTHPVLARTGLPAWLLMGFGAALGVTTAMKHPRRWTRILAGVDLLVVALFAVGFFVLSAVPASSQFQSLTRAPDFNLPDQHNHKVSLAQDLAKGPVLLVFYRGFW